MFLDTSGLFCCHHTGDPLHGEAARLFRAVGRQLTHGYILAELISLGLARGLPQTTTLGFVRSLRKNPRVDVVWVSESLHEEGMRLLAARPDKEYSLCDAISFVLMRQAGITDALTTDHHFEQEGFRWLLK